LPLIWEKVRKKASDHCCRGDKRIAASGMLTVPDAAKANLQPD
jgi:hypothetical protein